jgi:hypothetical protein
MNDSMVCKPSPVKILTVSAAPLRELLNLLIYGQNPELINERVRRQPIPALEKIPAIVRELKDVLKAEKCDKNGKLFFDCADNENHAAVLLHNQGAQFWIHYFRCGIGLVSLSFFSRLADAEGSLTNQIHCVTHSHEFQWFTHNLSAGLFSGVISETNAKPLGNYFVERVNPTLVSPYSIYFENPRIKEPYKFVSGSLERLKEVLTWTRFVCEGLKCGRDPNGKIWISPHMTINCGNLKYIPTFEHSTEAFINLVGTLAVRENAPYTVLREGFGRRAGGECCDWERKNKYRIFLNLESENRDAPVRVKIAACACLVNWLKEQGVADDLIIKIWNLGSESVPRN